MMGFVNDGQARIVCQPFFSLVDALELNLAGCEVNFMLIFLWVETYKIKVALGGIRPG